MNVALAFAQFLDDRGIAVLGQDLFVSKAPSSNQVPDAIWWVTSNGGSPQKFITAGARKTYTVNIYHRSRNYGEVYDSMQSLEELLNCSACVELAGYEVLDISAITFPIDNDLDDEDRQVGLLQATVTIMKGC